MADLRNRVGILVFNVVIGIGIGNTFTRIAGNAMTVNGFGDTADRLCEIREEYHKGIDSLFDLVLPGMEPQGIAVGLMGEDPPSQPFEAQPGLAYILTGNRDDTHGHMTGDLLAHDDVRRVEGQMRKEEEGNKPAEDVPNIISHSIGSGGLFPDRVKPLEEISMREAWADNGNRVVFQAMGNDGSETSSHGTSGEVAKHYPNYYGVGALYGDSEGNIHIANYTSGAYGTPTLWALADIPALAPYGGCLIHEGTSFSAPHMAGVFADLASRVGEENLWLLPWAHDLTAMPLEQVVAPGDPLLSHPAYNGRVPNPTAAAQAMLWALQNNAARPEDYLTERNHAQAAGQVLPDGSVLFTLTSPGNLNPETLGVGYKANTEQDFTVEVIAPTGASFLVRPLGESDQGASKIDKADLSLYAYLGLIHPFALVGHFYPQTPLPEFYHRMEYPGESRLPGEWMVKFTPADPTKPFSIQPENVFLDMQGFSFDSLLGSITSPQQIGVDATHNPWVDTGRDYLRKTGAALQTEGAIVFADSQVSLLARLAAPTLGGIAMGAAALVRSKSKSGGRE